MGWLDSIKGVIGGAASVSNPVAGVIAIAEKVINLFPDASQRAAAALELEKLKTSKELAQIAVNLEEAKGGISWRQGIGWTCCAGFAWEMVARPVLGFGFAAAGNPVSLPAADMSVIMKILLPLLGL